MAKLLDGMGEKAGLYIYQRILLQWDFLDKIKNKFKKYFLTSYN